MWGSKGRNALSAGCGVVLFGLTISPTAWAVEVPGEREPSTPGPQATSDHPGYPEHLPPPSSSSPPPNDPAPGDSLSDAELAAPFEEGERTHDGFYLRITIGAGVLSLNLETHGWGSPPRDISSSEAELLSDFMIGGTIVDGLTIGGGFLAAGDTGFSESNRTLLGLFGFVDWFPAPQGGFHVGVGLGRGAVDHHQERTFGGTNGSLMRAFTGYDFWFTSQWSAGVLLGWAGVVDDGFAAHLWSAAATLLYH